MIAQEESLMMMMMGAHPMLAESTKALNQAQIDGLRASGVENRFCVKLSNYKKIHDLCTKIFTYGDPSVP